MIAIKKTLDVLKNKWELFIGWFELVLKPGFDRRYKYIMEDIEIKEHQGKLSTMIHYKLVGCRKLNSESAIELNKLSLFSLFRSDHAQMIVSIATIEALMGKSQDEIYEKYKKYITTCNLKMDGRRN